MPMPRRYETAADRQRAYRLRRAQKPHTPPEDPTLPPAPRMASLPATRRWEALHDRAVEALHALQDEMTAYHVDRSETWQESDRGEAFQAIIDTVDAAVAAAEEIEI